MVVATRQQRGARGRTQRSRMETRVAQALRRQLFDVGRRHTATKCAELTETDIIEQDQQHIWGAFGWAHNLRKGWRIRVLVGAANVSRKVKVGSWQRLCCGWWRS